MTHPLLLLAHLIVTTPGGFFPPSELDNVQGISIPHCPRNIHEAELPLWPVTAMRPVFQPPVDVTPKPISRTIPVDYERELLTK